MNDIQAKIVLAGVGILFLACLLGSLTCCGRLRAAQEAWITGIERASRRVGTEPTLGSLAEYIVGSVEPGMSRSEVEQILGTIAPIEVIRGAMEDIDGGWGPTACDTILLKIGALPGQEWRIDACYNLEGELVLLQSYDSDFPPLGISAPIQR